MNPFIEEKREKAQARKEQIMALIKRKPISVRDVAEQFKVSIATARNDLNALKKGKRVGSYRSSEAERKGIMLYALPEQVPPGKRRKKKTTVRVRRRPTRARRSRPVRRRAAGGSAGNAALQTLINVLLDRLTQLEIKVDNLGRGKR